MSVISGNTNLYGYKIGILMIEGYFPRPPGAIGNATTFDFPVLHHVVRGASGAATVKTMGALDTGAAAYWEGLKPWIEGAQYLEGIGVRAITTSCGFTSIFQHEVSKSVSIPVCLSSLALGPFICATLGPGRRFGIVTANAEYLSTRHLEAAGIDPGRAAIIGLDRCHHFQEMVYGNNAHRVDIAVIEEEVVRAIRTVQTEESDIGALLLECSLLPPYAAAVQAASGLPVFDFTTMINMLHSSLHRRQFAGYL